MSLVANPVKSSYILIYYNKLRGSCAAGRTPFHTREPDRKHPQAVDEEDFLRSELQLRRLRTTDELPPCASASCHAAWSSLSTLSGSCRRHLGFSSVTICLSPALDLWRPHLARLLQGPGEPLGLGTACDIRPLCSCRRSTSNLPTKGICNDTSTCNEQTECLCSSATLKS